MQIQKSLASPSEFALFQKLDPRRLVPAEELVCAARSWSD
jgi:hypothetical protein